jgi:hypothetical protein
MRVALLPTGRTEWHGLPDALRRLFPEHEFYALPEPAVFRSTGPFDGITSSPLTERHEGAYLPEAATLLIGRAAQEALGDRRRAPADAVVVLDDLELANRTQPERVARVFRRAAERHLADLRDARGRTAAALRDRVSFHLIVPMIEAWFFADRQALRIAGVPDGVEPILGSDGLEDFRAIHLAYATATELECPRWIAKGRRKADRPKWLGEQRQRHPKGYLQWLCRDADAKDCTSYDESRSGAEALKALDWPALLDNPGLRYLHALVEDLAAALEEPVPPTRPAAASPAATCLSRRPQDHVLRNL